MPRVINQVLLSFFMETIIGDFHIHTKYSKEPKLLGIFKTKPFYGPEQVIKEAIRKGLGTVAITEHDTLKGAEIGEKIAKKYKKDIIFIKGEEISSRDGHVIGLGLEEAIRPGLSVAETIDRIKKQGGVAIAPHPFIYYGVGYRIFTSKFDGVEVVNPWASLFGKNRFVKSIIPEVNFAPIGSTDAHMLWMVGKIFTRLRIKRRSVDGVLDAIRKKRTTAGSDMDAAALLINLFGGIGVSLISLVRRNV
jgi:predicted metal-dependent phosphoesterase TrpH